MNNEKKITHVQVDPAWPTEPLGRVENVLDGITGFVEAWDFSLANSSYEARVYFISKIASICYQSPKSLGSINLFNRLQAESAGLPSSSYEFVPVLVSALDTTKVEAIHEGALANGSTSNFFKYSEIIPGTIYHLGNLRALIEDVGHEESLQYLNTSDEEIQIIRDNFKVFLFNVDVPTRTQMIRHRVSWQELSRRYVSGKKKEFDFYISKKMRDPVSHYIFDEYQEDDQLGTEDIIDICVAHYDAAIASGVKPEEARRILPQAMMTQIWGAFQPRQLESYFKLRLHKTAQREIQQVSEAMKELIDEN